MDLGGVGWTATAPGEAWQVRIGARDGTATGAGFVMGSRHVVTGAHVVEAARRTGTRGGPAVVVELVGLPGAPASFATTGRQGWFPAGEGGGADLALLELEAPAGVDPAPLYRLPATRGRPVRVLGYPPGTGRAGVWIRATLAVADTAGEWVPLVVDDPGSAFGPGFGGAPVLDEDTGHVIGITVGTVAGARSPWMLPVESILGYVGGRPGVRGEVAVDPALAAIEPDRPVDVELARPLARWLAGRGLRPVRLVATGDGVPPATVEPPAPVRGPVALAEGRELGRVSHAELCRLVVLADRELRPASDPRVVADAPRGTVPPAGSIELAVDASERTVSEVTRRIADRFGVTAGSAAAVTERMGDAAGSTMVVAGVDDARQPAELIDDVLVPLADHGLRLLLAFRRPWSEAWERAQAHWPDHDLDDDDPAVVADRLDTLAARIAEVADREDALLRRRTSVALRIAVVPGLPARATALRLRLAALHKAARGPDWAWLLPRLEGCERATGRVAARLDDLAAALDALLDRRAELRAGLEAERNRAVAAGVVRRSDLERLHRQADEALAAAPCDLAVAADLVARYGRAVGDREG